MIIDKYQYSTAHLKPCDRRVSLAYFLLNPPYYKNNQKNRDHLKLIRHLPLLKCVK